MCKHNDAYFQCEICTFLIFILSSFAASIYISHTHAQLFNSLLQRVQILGSKFSLSRFPLRLPCHFSPDLFPLPFKLQFSVSEWVSKRVGERSFRHDCGSLRLFLAPLPSSLPSNNGVSFKKQLHTVTLLALFLAYTRMHALRMRPL